MNLTFCPAAPDDVALELTEAGERTAWS